MSFIHRICPRPVNLKPSSSSTLRQSTSRTFTTSLLHRRNRTSLPPRPTLPDHDLKHVYLKGSGPGGQKINKTSSAVQLTHIPTGIVVKSQATRSQSQNHTIARRILAEKIELMEKGGESRAAKVVERKKKRKASKLKKSRRKYRRLEEGVVGTEAGLGLGKSMTGGVEGEEIEEGEEEYEDDEDDIEEERVEDETFDHVHVKNGGAEDIDQRPKS